MLPSAVAMTVLISAISMVLKPASSSLWFPASDANHLRSKTNGSC